MRKIYLLFASALIFAGCYNDTVEELYPATNNNGTGCDTASVTYSSSIKPIVDSKCATSGCHDAATVGGGYNMSTYDGVKAASARIMGAIRQETGYSAMPKSANKLDDCSIAKFDKWIAEGAQNN